MARQWVADGHRPDFVHSHDWFLFASAADLAFNCQCPLISSFHLTQAVFDHWGEGAKTTVIQAEQHVCSNASRLLTISESMKQEICTFYNVQPSLMHVVLNGCDIDNFEPSGHELDLEEKLTELLSGNRHIILFAGRLVPQKGVPELLESAEVVLRERDDVAYVLVGAIGGRYERRLMEYCKQSKLLNGRVLFCKMLERNSLGKLYKAASLVAMPSCYEPFGFSALEAMLSGTCVLASASGGMPEFIKDGVNGFLVPTTIKDGVTCVKTDALARLQLELLANDALRSEIGMAAESSMRSDFSRGRMAHDTVQQYMESPVYRGPTRFSLGRAVVPSI